MGLPLDQEQLIASLEELEKRLRQSRAANEAEADNGPRLDPASSSYAYPQPDVAPHREPSFDVGANSERLTEDRDNRRRLLLAFSALIMVVFVGALGATLAYWTAPSPAPVAASPESPPAPVDAASAPAEAAPPEAELTSAPVKAAPEDSAQVAPAAPAASSAPPAQASAAVEAPAPRMDAPATPTAQPTAPAAPQQVQTVTILPDGTLAPKVSSQQPDPAFAPPAYSTPPGGVPSQGSSPTATNPSDATKPASTAPNLAAKIAKKKAAKAAAKAAAPKPQAAATADRPAEPAPSPTPAPAGDGFLQGAQRALGSVTGAVKKLVGGE